MRRQATQGSASGLQRSDQAQLSKAQQARWQSAPRFAAQHPGGAAERSSASALARPEASLRSVQGGAERQEATLPLVQAHGGEEADCREEGSIEARPGEAQPSIARQARWQSAKRFAAQDR